MDNLFSSPLDDITSKDVKNLSEIETKIPIPSPAFLQKTSTALGKTNNEKMEKHQREFDLFCRWAALPKDLRNPKTAVAFEKKYSLPKNYTTYFRSREEFQNQRLTYFWEWLFDLYPDVVYAVYQRAIAKSSKDAGIFVDIMSKHLETNKPRLPVQPMILVGVPQDKIDRLFTPKEYEDVTPIMPTRK